MEDGYLDTHWEDQTDYMSGPEDDAADWEARHSYDFDDDDREYDDGERLEAELVC